MKLRRTHFPYCLQKTPGGYIILNSLYKPLGITSSEHIDYDTHPASSDIKITPALAMQLSWKGESNMEQIHLCGPDPSSETPEQLASYFKRLLLLSTLQLTPSRRHR